MRILIFDEDTESGIIESFCEQMTYLGQEVIHVSDWKRLSAAIEEFKPDAFIIDMMMPAIGLPAEQCGAGYTTGAHVYKSIVFGQKPSSPFLIFTAADVKTTRIARALETLHKYPGFSGIFEKGEDAQIVLDALVANSIQSVPRE